jgi:ABC-type oligopeptide transport system substrate-binding subunit
LDGKQAPTPIEIVSNSQSPLAQAELEFVRKSWARLGIDLKPKFITDWAQFEDYLKSDSLQIYRYAWFADIPDPDDMLRPLFSGDSPFNFTRHRDELVDRMLKEALGMVDPIARAERYRQIESMMLESCPIIPLIHMSIDLVYQANVMGIAVNALGAHTMSFHRVWLRNANGQ